MVIKDATDTSEKFVIKTATLGAFIGGLVVLFLIEQKWALSLAAICIILSCVNWFTSKEEFKVKIINVARYGFFFLLFLPCAGGPALMLVSLMVESSEGVVASYKYVDPGIYLMLFEPLGMLIGSIVFLVLGLLLSLFPKLLQK